MSQLRSWASETALSHIHHCLFPRTLFLEANIYVTKYYQSTTYIRIWHLPIVNLSCWLFPNIFFPSTRRLPGYTARRSLVAGSQCMQVAWTNFYCSIVHASLATVGVLSPIYVPIDVCHIATGSNREELKAIGKLLWYKKQRLLRLTHGFTYCCCTYQSQLTSRFRYLQIVISSWIFSTYLESNRGLRVSTL
jgi:hypothetical protein